MAQIKKSYQELRIPFQKMSFTPDVPAAALGPNEFNAGLNVETDVRGLRSVAGDVPTMPPAPGVPTFITGGYRQPCGEEPNDFYFVIANEAGEWWATNGTLWQEITPIGLTGSYTQDQNITEAWSGTVPIFNDEQSPPMFWPEDANRKALTITAASGDGATATLTFTTQATPPWTVGQDIAVYNIQPPGYQGVWTVTNCTTSTVEYACTESGTFAPSVQDPPATVASVLPLMRLYSNQLPIAIFDITAPTATTRQLDFAGVCETTGSAISGTTLTVGTMTLPASGSRAALMAPGMWLTGTGITAGTKVVRNISGQGDGSTWEVNISQTVASTAIDGYPWGQAGVGPAAPYQAGEYIRLTDVSPRYYDGTWAVTACDEDSVTIACGVTDAYTTSTGQINPEYAWNYNPNWSSVYAKWLRIYNTPNVGSILVAGNLTATSNATGEVENYPVTVQWSQSFGLNQVPVTWAPTTTNIANQLEVPVRGDSLDGFPCNGNFFVSSFWDTVVFSPLNYATTATPILGVRQFNQGRGLLNPNCWANADQKVYGMDARDVWVFDGNAFQGLGNQRVKKWLFEDIDPDYYSRVYMETNTNKNQIEIFYPTRDATAGKPNRMISYRYDLDVWNPPREVTLATFSCEAPLWSTTLTYYNRQENSTSGLGTGFTIDLVRGYDSYTIADGGNAIIDGGSGYAIGDTLTFTGDTIGGITPNNDATFTVTAIGIGLLGPGSITAGTWSGTPAQHWRYDPASRTVVYAIAAADRALLTKDQGYAFWNTDLLTKSVIASEFRKDNIKFLEDYSGKLLVHRMLPEVVNLDDQGLEIDPSTQDYLIGSIDIRVEGANSVGQPAVQTTEVTVNTDTDTPWAQIDQNAHRVNTLVVNNTSEANIWMLTATTFQLTQTEDDR